MKVVTNNTLSYFWSKLKTLLGAKQDTLVSGTNIKTINNTSLLGSGDISVQAPLTFDSTPTALSNNPVTSNGIATALSGKKDKSIELLSTYGDLFSALSSATEENPATLTAAQQALYDDLVSKYGVKDFTFWTVPVATNEEGYTLTGNMTFDSYHIGNNDTISVSINKTSGANTYWLVVENTSWQTALTFDNAPTSSSTNPVTSSGIATALSNKQDTLTFDNNPTANSNNVVKSGGVYSKLQGKKNAESTDMVFYFGLTKAALISALNGSSEDNPVTLSGTALEKWNELIADVTDEKRTWTYAFQPVAVNYNDASNRGVTFMGGVTSNNQEPILWEFHKDGNNYWMTRTTVSYAKTSDLTSKQDTLTWATTSDIDDMMLEEVVIDEPDPGIEIEE